MRRSGPGRQLDEQALAGRSLQVDGLNVIIGLEVALSGGPLLRGDDGTLRDLAGLRGSYKVLDATRRAAALLQLTTRALGVTAVHFWLDAPVANSGRLRALLEEQDPSWTASLVPDADRALLGREYVASADAVVLDRCGSWFDLGSAVVRAHVPTAWVVELCLS